jgi:predicted metalloprotease
MDKAEANSLQVHVELQADCFAGIDEFGDRISVESNKA